MALGCRLSLFLDGMGQKLTTTREVMGRTFQKSVQIAAAKR